MNTELLAPPYGKIIVKLIESTKRALGEFIASSGEIISPDAVDDIALNRHFTWLRFYCEATLDSHLYSGDDIYSSYEPLFVKSLRFDRRIPENIINTLQQGESIDLQSEELNSYVKNAPTRISLLIKSAVENTQKKQPSPDSGKIILPSPLAIAYSFLTIPDHLGSRAYALIPLRNFLFEQYKVAPDGFINSDAYSSFATKDLEAARRVIWNSLRPRYNSRGEDKLAANGKRPIDGVLRHFLAMLGILHFRFNNFDDLRSFLESELYLPDRATYELDKDRNLDHLPELGELVNQLWGLPLPLRGADTLFRGGIKFPSTGGLICAIHGGPGSGKTSLALAIGASLSGLGIKTVYFTAEEQQEDLQNRTYGLLATEMQQLSFMPESPNDWLRIINYFEGGGPDPLNTLMDYFKNIADMLAPTADDTESYTYGPPSPCKAVIVLDGLHDLMRKELLGNEGVEGVSKLHAFIETCKKLNALVVLTTGTDWEADSSLDYLVDVAIRLTHKADSEDRAKPERFINLSKTRHQLCSPGVHGFQLSGTKGLRFLPQMNYQLDRRAIWKPLLADKTIYKRVFKPREQSVIRTSKDTRIYRNSSIFINGEGSSGKAGLALRIAISPSYRSENDDNISIDEKILIISFLYPLDYYNELHKKIQNTTKNVTKPVRSSIGVIHLYPGHIRPAMLLNKIESKIQSAELTGKPFTSVIIDGIHNIFLQFPEIEKESLFWPQLISMLNTREIGIITTHTMLTIPKLQANNSSISVDDHRSDPLRHALVQKTDFHLEVIPEEQSELNDGSQFEVRILSALNQPTSRKTGKYIWNREELIFQQPSSLL